VALGGNIPMTRVVWCSTMNILLAIAFALALMPRPSSAASDRRLAHPVLVGAGATWIDPGVYHRSAYPGAMVGLDLSLGRYSEIGVFGDVTSINNALFGQRTHVLTGLDFKLLPLPTGWLRPWVMAGAAGSVVDDTGYAIAWGAGSYFVPGQAVAYFVDVRRYYVRDMENPAFDQVVLRAGVVF